MIRPCNDFVLLEKEKAEEKTASGIILTDKNTEKPTVGKVLAVNNGHEVDGKHVECCVKVNDRDAAGAVDDSQRHEQRGKGNQPGSDEKRYGKSGEVHCGQVAGTDA